MKYLFQWLGQNWPIMGGLCTAVYFVFKLGQFFAAIVIKVSSVVSRFEAAEFTLEKVATNHLPHMQAELEKTNQTMSSMDETLKKLYAHQIRDYD
jgi:hypothetical protein